MPPEPRARPPRASRRPARAGPSRARSSSRPGGRAPRGRRRPRSRRRARPRRARSRRRRAYARSTTVCPACGSTSSSSRTGVAFTIRSQPSASGGQSPRREKTRVSAGSAGGERARRAAGADQAGPRRVDPGEDLAVGVEAEHAAVAEDERVDRVALGLVARGDDRLLVRDRHVRAGEAERRSARDRRDRVVDVERGVVPVEPERGEGRVLHPRRERVRDRVAEQRDLRSSMQPYPCVREVLVERGRARGEEVVHLVRLAHEVEVVDLRRDAPPPGSRRGPGSRSASAAGRGSGACCTGVALRAATAGSTASAGCAARSGASRRSRAASARAAGCRSRPRSSGRSRGATASFSIIEAMISTSYGRQVLRARVAQVDLPSCSQNVSSWSRTSCARRSCPRRKS